MAFWKNYQELCKSKGKSANGVAKELGISSGAVTAWKKGTNPQNQKLSLIAEYFDIPVATLTEENLSIKNARNSRKYKQTRKEIQRMSEQLKKIASETNATTICQTGLRPAYLKHKDTITTINPIEKKLLETFRSTTDIGRMEIIEAAIRIKIKNETAEIAIAKDPK